MLSRIMFATLFLLAPVLGAQADPIAVTDVVGRTVHLDAPAKRIVIAEARQLIALSLVDRDVAERIVGWAAVVRLGAQLTEAYIARYPNLANIPDVEADNSLSAEEVIALEPDLVVMSGGTAPQDRAMQLVKTFEASGIPTVFIDFRSDPLGNTIPSLRLLGEVLAQPEQAAAFIKIYEDHKQAIIDRIAETNPDRPSVMMHMQAHAGNAINVPGEANLGAFIAAAGGDNIGAPLSSGMFAQINPEHILAVDPDIYIGTGGTHFTPDTGIVVGPGVDQKTAQQSLRTAMNFDIIRELTAIREGHVHGLWHNFHNSPLNIIALEVLAKWFHPDIFADLKPEETVELINEQFLSVPFDGVTWATLEAE